MRKLILVDEAVLPEVYSRVIHAKSLLKSGEAANATEASKMSGISRSAFYKYRDHVFSYSERGDMHVITLHAILLDNPGVLSAFINGLYLNSANILTVNQDIPSDGMASVSVSMRVSSPDEDPDGIINSLKNVNGVVSVVRVLG